MGSPIPPCVTAKTFAGLHTAVHLAFKLIKKKEKEQAKALHNEQSMTQPAPSRQSYRGRLLSCFWSSRAPELAGSILSARWTKSTATSLR